MTGGRRFTPRSPDWGQGHLSLDAIVAYVDGELTAGPHTRAEAHLDGCAECRAEVVVQRQARTMLRAASTPCLPSSLLRSLRSIPTEAELPPPPPGLGITAEGQFVLLRDVPGGPEPSAATGQPPARWLSRRARVGAVSGLAIGALAVGALAVPGATGPSAPGLLGGAVLGVPVQGVPEKGVPEQARLSPVPAVPAVSPGVAAADPAVLDRSTDDPTTDAATDTDAVDAPTATTPGDSSAVLDPRVRARLDRSPVAFFRSP